MSIGSANAGFILKQERVILRAIVCAFVTNDLLLHFMYDREKANIATAFRVTSICWIALPGNIHIPPSLKIERLPKPIQVKRLKTEMQKYRK